LIALRMLAVSAAQLAAARLARRALQIEIQNGGRALHLRRTDRLLNDPA
jgi:hypothetical protein